MLFGSDESPGSSEATLSDSEYYQMLFGSDESLGAHPPQPNPNPKKRPWTDMNPDPDFDWDRWTTIVNRPSPPKEFGQANGYLVKHLQQPDPVPSTNWDFDRIYSPEPVSEVHPPSMSAGLSAGPEHEEATPSLDLGPLEEP